MSGKYICFEGSEGVGKTTQVNLLVNHLRAQGARVLHTKEPGTDLSPITLELRKLILDAKYEDPTTGWVGLNEKLNEFLSDRETVAQDITTTARLYLFTARMLISLHKRMTTESREFILQAVRSITLEKVVVPGLKNHDYVIQDRGILSGLSYGEAGGVDLTFMYSMNNEVVKSSGLSSDWTGAYAQIIMLQGNVAKGLTRAQSAKKEFETADVMEQRGVSFLEKVNNNFSKHLSSAKNVSKITVDDKSIEQIHKEILGILK